jgi:tRNA pseudouridine38-40 synthase
MNNEGHSVKRWRCLCAYDGTNYTGWQKQPTQDSVQNHIENALKQIFSVPIRTIGAGRTDAGVHANGQVFHFDHEWKHGEEKMLQALRSHLPSDISPREIKEVSPSFHALSSAKGKCYLYRAVIGWAMPQDERFCLSLKNQNLDLVAMKEASKFLVGKHDFTAFAASQGKQEKEDPVKEIWLFEISCHKNEIHFLVEGSGFLYKMVRSMVGGLLEVGRGRIQVDTIQEILQSCQRTEVVVSAPAKGLCLQKVYYKKTRFSDL